MDVAFRGLPNSLKMSIEQLVKDVEDFGEPQMDTIRLLEADLHWLEDIIAECNKIREFE